MPAWGQERIHDMVAERPDWCISRQRFWGVPLIIFYCEGCGKHLADYQALRSVLPFFEREGADAWFTHTAEELLPPGTKCACGAAKWRKEKDVLDVWFDSGSTHLAVLSEKDGTWPADVYLEGPDQYRGWFHSSLLVAMGMRGSAPYRQVVTHGWTLDEKGAADVEVAGQRDVSQRNLREMGRGPAAGLGGSQDYTADMRMSEAMMTQLAEAYRKIRNTFRFALGNLVRLRSGARRGGRFRAVGAGRLDASPHRRAGEAMPRVVSRISNFTACITRFTIFARWT